MISADCILYIWIIFVWIILSVSFMWSLRWTCVCILCSKRFKTSHNKQYHITKRYNIRSSKSLFFSCQASKEQEASRRAESFNDFFSAEEASSTAVAPKATPPSDSICVHGFLMKVNNDGVFTCVFCVFYVFYICVLCVFLVVLSISDSPNQPKPKVYCAQIFLQQWLAMPTSKQMSYWHILANATLSTLPASLSLEESSIGQRCRRSLWVEKMAAWNIVEHPKSLNHREFPPWTRQITRPWLQ